MAKGLYHFLALDHLVDQSGLLTTDGALALSLIHIWKMGLAEQGIANLLMHVDSLIVIPNERLKMISQEKITLMNAFQAADNVLRQGVEMCIRDRY